jgi:hypothetical protein
MVSGTPTVNRKPGRRHELRPADPETGKKHERFLKAASAPMAGFTPPLTTFTKCLSWDDHP